jgi:3-oxoacyl-[acyl-carrier protein] reductase
MASVMAHVVGLGMAQYAASKCAVVGLTRSAALEAAARGVCVNAVAPGTIETPLNVALAGSVEAMRERWVGSYPMGRLGQPDEVADAVLWLLGDTSSFVTGKTILIEGGMSLR